MSYGPKMIFVAISSLILLCVEARFSFILNVRSHSTRGSCDPWPASECETYFSLFCLRGSSAQQSDDTYYCPLGANRGRLEEQTGTRTIISSNQPWPITFQLFIQAWDEDLIDDDFLDNIFIEGSLINSDFSPVTTVTGSRSRVTMTVQFRRVCDKNYYDVSCSTHCVAADDDTRGHYTCNPNNGSKQCLPGYKGQDCLENSNDCFPNPCSNAGNCTDLLSDFICECPPGYTGKKCSIDIDECAENSCPGNSICEDRVNNYRCVCNYGHTGQNCTQVLHPCESGPCVNGGTCVAVDSFTSICVCLAGYTGSVCELNIDNCLNASCPLGTSCQNGNNTYECVRKSTDQKFAVTLNIVMVGSIVGVAVVIVLGCILVVVLMIVGMKQRNKKFARRLPVSKYMSPFPSKSEEQEFNHTYKTAECSVSLPLTSPAGSVHRFENPSYNMEDLRQHISRNRDEMQQNEETIYEELSMKTTAVASTSPVKSYNRLNPNFQKGEEQEKPTCGIRVTTPPPAYSILGPPNSSLLPTLSDADVSKRKVLNGKDSPRKNELKQNSN